MKYYIDFDNTLFNTENFYNDLLKIASKYNISKEDIELYFKNNFANQLFNPLKIIDCLVKKNDINKNIHKELKNFFRNISNYLYEDSINFLEFLNNDNNNELILLTYGDFIYQNEKINKSGIRDYFKEIIITSKDKGDLVLDYENSIFIDDNIEQIKGLIKKGSKVIRIMRVGNKYSSDIFNKIPQYSSLKDYINDFKK